MENKMTGYSFIDKPWLKNYQSNILNERVPRKTLYNYLYERNKDYKAGTALNYAGNEISYDEFFENVEKVAKAFKQMGVKNGETVTLCPVNIPEFVYAFYALNEVGATINMVLPTANKNEIIKYMKETNSTKVVILDAKCSEISKAIRESKDDFKIDWVISTSLSDSMPLYEKIKSASNKMIRDMSKKMKEEYKNQTSGLNEFIRWKDFVKKGKKYSGSTEAPYEENKTAVIVRSGGSTGKPKGIELTNENFNAMVLEHDKAPKLELTRGMTCLQTISMYAPFGSCNNMHLPLCKGIQLQMQPIYNPQEFIKKFLKYKPNVTFSTPQFLFELKKYIVEQEKITGKKEDLSDYVYAIVGGESPSKEKLDELNDFLLDRGKRWGVNVGYGMSEACSAICCTNLGDANPDKSGIPYADINLKVVDPETNEPLKYNEAGVLYVSGPTVMKQYLNNEEETKKVLSKDDNGIVWYYTGDICSIDEEGNVKPYGRLSRIAKKFDGCNVPLTEVEDVIESHPAVENCIVIAIKDPEHETGEALKAFVTLKPEYKYQESLIENDIIIYTKNNINERYGIYSVKVKDTLPLTSMGKKNFKAIELEEKISNCPLILDCNISNSVDENYDFNAEIDVLEDNNYIRNEINKYINNIMSNQPSNSRYRINVIINNIKYSDNGSVYEKAYVKEM